MSMECTDPYPTKNNIPLREEPSKVAPPTGRFISDLQRSRKAVLSPRHPARGRQGAARIMGKPLPRRRHCAGSPQPRPLMPAMLSLKRGFLGP